LRCGDERDKIYGMLGIMKAWHNERLIVDYERPVQTIYAQAFRIIVEDSMLLDILCTQIWFPARARMLGLPSWCPDWSKNLNRADITDQPPNSLFQYDPNSYHASGTTKAVVHFSDGNKVMFVEGLWLDVVENLSDELTEPFQLIEESKRLKWMELEKMALAGAKGPYWSRWKAITPATSIPSDDVEYVMPQALTQHGGGQFMQ
jgi:hypothetical protein